MNYDKISQFNVYNLITRTNSVRQDKKEGGNRFMNVQAKEGKRK